MSRAILCAAILALAPSISVADLIVPPLKKEVKEVKPLKVTENVKVSVIYSGNKDTQRPRLEIPKKFMTAAADGDGVPTAQGTSGRMLFSGLALCATLVTGGLWFVRRSGKGGRVMLTVCVLCGLLAASAFVPSLFGNVGPPIDFNKLKPAQVEITGRSAKLTVDIAIVPEGEQIRLVLPDALAPAAMKK